MEEKKLNEEQMEEVNGGMSVGETLDYAVEQGKKVARVMADTFEKLTKKD